MRFKILATALALVASSACATAQATSAASKKFELSAFGGLTGAYTGLNGGRNLQLTAGADLGFHPLFGLTPSAEFRGAFSVDRGQVDSQKYALGGVRVERQYGALQSYVDFLIGRGEIDYGHGGYPSAIGNFLYASTTSAVLSPGAGLALYLSPHFDAFADVQLQRYSTPVSSSGHLWAKPITLGVIYRFSFERHGNPGPYYR